MAKPEISLFELHPDLKINVVSSTPTTPDQSSPTLVFLHYWGGTSSTWSSVTALLSPKYQTVALDSRGWGKSTGPADAHAYSISHLADDVEAIVRRFPLENIVLVGHSMGAKVVQAIASRQSLPGLKGIVLVSPAPPTPLVLPKAMRDQQIHAYDNTQSADLVVRNVLTATAPGDDVVDALVRDMLSGNQFAKAAWPAYAMGEDISALLDNINVPTLVVAAELDVVEPLGRVEKEVAGRLKNAKLRVIQKSGHLIPVEAPDALVGILLYFLGSL
ncbi:Alpha/Beta hydrolase protein [Xylariales sp. AK1849]|nr:Alpha/Beta hydrolase protein [Xylariales sp. AK1849]